MEKYQTDEHEETVSVEIGKSVALVLDNLLHRWMNQEGDSSMQIEHDAEWHVLLLLSGALETRLAEPFDPDYLDQVEMARQKVVQRWGAQES